ncbi:MAG: hypothetical protein A2W25_14130 [candidate division Zixibacteria bacterium RBG_16_53_22]|nr:MAG: hypothetical protein A2W25_14130 [candidate division Zixibacteria bacterium RBG_16_53_22]
MTDLSSIENLRARLKSTCPGYRFSWEIYTDLVLENVRRCPSWLDIGAGSNIWIREQPGADLAVGVDVEKPKGLSLQPDEAYCLAKGESLPFKDESFHFITSRYVLEHLKAPRTVLAEIDRVLKSSGVLLLQTTNKANPLVAASRLIPFGIKKRLLRWLFDDIPSGVFRTFYKFNRPSCFKKQIGKLHPEKIIMVEDVLTQNRIMFTVSFALMRLFEKLDLQSLMGNIIAIYRKNTE